MNKSAKSRNLIELVRQKAIAKWGEKRWFAELVRAYVAAESEQTGKHLKPTQRRPQLARLFETEDSSLTLDTATLLLATVDGEIQVVFRHPEVKTL